MTTRKLPNANAVFGEIQAKSFYLAYALSGIFGDVFQDYVFCSQNMYEFLSKTSVVSVPNANFLAFSKPTQRIL